jgi:hypothetical protein
MTLRIFQISFILVVFVACGRIEDKTKQFSDKVKSTTKQLIDTTVNKVLYHQKPDSFSIRSIVTDFRNYKTIIEIKGIQTDNDFFYIEYCVYRGKKNKVLKVVNAIVPKKLNDFISDRKCYSVTGETLYHDIAPNEKNKETAFFWKFEKLKSYEIYRCIKAPLRHYIVFDKNSDTVYHRIEELRE